MGEITTTGYAPPKTQQAGGSQLADTLAQLQATLSQIANLLQALPARSPGSAVPGGAETVVESPPVVLAWSNPQAAPAGVGLLANAVGPPAAGHLILRLAVSAAAVVSVTETPTETPPSGGSSQANTQTLNQGTAVTAGAWYEFAIACVPQATYNLQLSISATASVLVLYIPR